MSTAVTTVTIQGPVKSVNLDAYAGPTYFTFEIVDAGKKTHTCTIPLTTKASPSAPEVPVLWAYAAVAAITAAHAGNQPITVTYNDPSTLRDLVTLRLGNP